MKYAKEIDKSITMDDINKFMDNVSFRNKKRYSNYNSFIVNFPRDEFMVDLIELGFWKKVNIIIVLYVWIYFQNLHMLLKFQVKIPIQLQLY